MATVQLKNIKKVYPISEEQKKEKRKKTNLEITEEGVVAVQSFNLDIADKEFIVLVGPSGCGKSTTLRMVAGLEDISGGELVIDGKVVNDVAPKDRDIAMVFQSYALYPHMTVYENMAFSLKLRKVPKEEIDKKVREAAEILDITQYLNRKPKALSGGQRQRVAIGRAIVRAPKVMLMDEPLSNLDAKLRIEMRSAIKDIQREVGITTVYVTHDQEEAMAVSDRIAVMDNGVIQHVGTPRNIYQRPANLFVSTFIGRSNVIEGKLKVQDGKCIIETVSGYSAEMPNVADEYRSDRDIYLSVRPEDFIFAKEGESGITATVSTCVFLGLNTHYFCKLETGQDVIIIQESSIDNIIAEGSQIKLTINTKKLNIFDKESEKNILEGVQNDCLG